MCVCLCVVGPFVVKKKDYATSTTRPKCLEVSTQTLGYRKRVRTVRLFPSLNFVSLAGESTDMSFLPGIGH